MVFFWVDEKLEGPWCDYFKYPEGEECAQKIGWCAYKGTLIGAVAGVADAMLITRTVGFTPSLFLVARRTFPVFAMAVGFASITCVAVGIRKKDDYVNVMLGGAASAAMWGAFAGKMTTSFSAMPFLIGGACVFKFSKEWVPRPHQHSAQGRFDHVKSDYSIYPDVRKQNN